MAQPHTRQAIVEAIMKRRGTEVFHQKEKKSMKGYVPSYLEGDEKCVVCGDRATGYHYKCITCEGCKGFFRRTVQKNLQSTYQCKHDNACEINKTTRNQCQMCRYDKCVKVGMATELVLDDEKRQAKRRLIEQNREIRKHKELTHMMAQCGWRIERPSEEERELINSIVQAQNEAFKDADVALGRILNSVSASDKFSTALTSAITSVVNFAKNIPLLTNKVNAEDLIYLLKGGCIDVITLRCVVSYEKMSKSVTLFPCVKVTKENLRYTRLEPFAQSLFSLAEQFSALQLSDVDVALMQAITLLNTDRLNTSVDKNKVEFAQGILLKAFEHYTSEKWPNEPQLCTHLLIKLREVRAVSSCLANSLMRMRLDDPEDLHKLFVTDIVDSRYIDFGPKFHSQHFALPVPVIYNEPIQQVKMEESTDMTKESDSKSKYSSWRNDLFSTMMEDTRKALQETEDKSQPKDEKEGEVKVGVKRPLSLPTKFDQEESSEDGGKAPSTSNVKHKVVRRIRSHSPVHSSDISLHSKDFDVPNHLYVPNNLITTKIYHPLPQSGLYPHGFVFPNVSKTTSLLPIPTPMMHRFPLYQDIPMGYHFPKNDSMAPARDDKIVITNSDSK